MSKKAQEIINEKDSKKIFLNNQNKTSIIKKNINKIVNLRNKTSFSNYRRNKIQINKKDEAYIERKSFNNELNDNDNKKKTEKNDINNNNNNIDNNENEYNDKIFVDNIDNYEKPPNAIEISDLIGEKCSLDLDILSINFNNYESSKTSSKKMGLIHAYGANTYQGLVRNYNEDRVSIIINMSKPKNYTKKYWPKTSFFGIYDGHGGNQCSEFLRDSLHKLILNDQYYPENVELAIKNGFKKAEQNFFNDYALDQNDNNNILDRSGSCAIVILFVDEIIYVANVGDSRALLSENNGSNFVVITEDHKPNNPKEKKRIIKNGGHVYQSQTVINGTEKESLNGQILFGPFRVLPGRLSVSRTIGDIEAKNVKFGGNPNVIICEPDIFVYDLKKDKIDFFLMGCDGIFDQMSNEEIIDCAWMILNNNKKGEYLNNIDDNNDNDEENENTEYNFENYTIHEKCGLIVDLILKASMVRKSFDNVTCLMIALSDFTNNDNSEMSINQNEKKEINKQIIAKPKKSAQVISRRKIEITKDKSSDNQILNDINLNKDNNKDIQTNKAKENIKLTNFMNSKDNKAINDTFSRTYRNNQEKFRQKNSFNTNTHIINNNNKIYIKKRKERNLQKNNTNKTEITINGDSNASNKIIKKILNKSEFKENRKSEFHNKSSDKNKSNNLINNDKLNISQSQNDVVINYNSPLNSKNSSINYNRNKFVHKLKNNKLNKIPFQLNNKIINNTNINKNKLNTFNVNFYLTNPGPNNYKKLPNIKTNSIGNISHTHHNLNHATSTSMENSNLNRAKKIKNLTKPKAFRYSNNSLYPYRELTKNNLIGNRIQYSNNTHNVSENNNLYLHNYSHNFDMRNNNNSRGSMSSRKKKFSYHQIIKTLTMNNENNTHNKLNQISSKKSTNSKEKDIQNFLYKNKTNIKINPNDNGNNNDLNKKMIFNKFSKLTMKNGKKKIKI